MTQLIWDGGSKREEVNSVVKHWHGYWEWPNDMLTC